jgi:hypothetical protein
MQLNLFRKKIVPCSSIRQTRDAIYWHSDFLCLLVKDGIFAEKAGYMNHQGGLILLVTVTSWQKKLSI